MIKGIIFDMDNTLLQSRIDYAGMKRETFQFLFSHGILSGDIQLDHHTTATIIAEAVQSTNMTKELLREMWEIPKKHETLGMHQAELEPGVKEVLLEWKGKLRLAIVTNNSIDAAAKALMENGIIDYFDCIVGRETIASLKPAPDGYLYILDKFNRIPANEWLSVGDSWIDGKASTTAGIKFISYRGDLAKMNRMGVFPAAEIEDIRELKNWI